MPLDGDALGTAAFASAVERRVPTSFEAKGRTYETTLSKMALVQPEGSTVSATFTAAVVPVIPIPSPRAVAFTPYVPTDLAMPAPPKVLDVRIPRPGRLCTGYCYNLWYYRNLQPV